MSSEVIAVTLALASALMFAFTFTLVRVGVKSASSETALWVTLSINVVFLWGWSIVGYGWQFGDWWQWRYFVLAGIFAPLLGRLFQFLGMARLGSNITTPLTLTHPVVSVVLAMAFLGETLTLLGLFGALLVIIGSVFVGSQGGKNQTASLKAVPEFDKLPSTAVSRKSPEDRKKDVEDVLNWLRSGKPVSNGTEYSLKSIDDIFTE